MSFRITMCSTHIQFTKVLMVLIFYKWNASDLLRSRFVFDWYWSESLNNPLYAYKQPICINFFFCLRNSMNEWISISSSNAHVLHILAFEKFCSMLSLHEPISVKVLESLHWALFGVLWINITSSAQNEYFAGQIH